MGLKWREYLSVSRATLLIVFCFIKSFGHPKHSEAFTSFFGNKLVGLPELWLNVVYNVIKQVPHLVENPGLMDAFKDHMLYRMKNKNTNM